MKKLESITFIIAAVIIAALASCVKDLDGGKEKSGDRTALVTLTLSMPSLPPATRVQGTSTENRVEEIDVLLFDASDNFYYRARGTNISAASDASSDEEKKTFTVKLPTGTYRVVVLANALDAISALATPLPISTIATGIPRSRAGILDKIAFSITGKMGTTRFPMWGDETLTIDGTPVTTAVKLTRAIARVDVSVVDATSAVTGTNVRDKFEISSVYLYNYSRAGSVAPLVDGAGYDLAAPHLPALVDLADSSTPIKVKGPVEHVVPAAGKHAFRQAIYACEALAATGEADTNTCLVVGGTYTGEDGNDIDTYYRVEFINTSSAYLALARNHFYDVVIQDVNGPGWLTKEDAYANKPSNIVVTIEAWNDGGMSEVLFDGQHSLTVDKSRLEFYKEGIAKSMTVSTTYPGGWTAEDLPAWLTPVTATGGAAGAEATLSFTAVPDDPGDLPRPGEFYIVAGNLRKKISVTQRDEIEFWIVVTDLAGNPVNELLFKAGDASIVPAGRAFRVTWLPVSIGQVDISADPAASYMYGGLNSFDFGANTFALADPAGSGAVEFTVRPLYNPSVARSTRVDFSITDGTRSMMLPLYLRQEGIPPTYAFSDGGATLTLFSDFNRGTKLALSPDNIPELTQASVGEAVKRIVIHGDAPDLTVDQMWNLFLNVEDNTESVWDPSVPSVFGPLPNLAHVSYPDFTGEIWFHDYYEEDITWLESFSAPLATSTSGWGTFAACVNLTTVDLPAVKTLGEVTFTYATGLEYLDLPAVEYISAHAFRYCLGLKTLKLGYQNAITTEANIFSEIGYLGYSTTNIDLYLGKYEYDNNVSGKTWKGYTFRSIKPY